MGAVVVLTMMRVLLFVCKVSMLRECKGDGNAGVGAKGGVSAGCEYMGGTPVVSNADDVLEIECGV